MSIICRRVAAEAARPLLTKKVYGVQHGYFHFHRRFLEGLNLDKEEEIALAASDDSFIPKGFKFERTHDVKGKREGIWNLAASVSSVREFYHVLEMQTQEHNKDRQQQKQHYDEQKQNQWSSQHIASLLNLERYEREQLEGGMYAGFESPSLMLTFDNRTIEEYVAGTF